MGRRISAILLILLALGLIILAPIIAFTSVGTSLLVSTGISAPPATPTPTPSPTPIPVTPTPIPTPQPILTVQGTPPALSATSSYLLDTDTGHVLETVNSQAPVPMASTTKIMTALIAIQAGNLDQTITVGQDAIDRVGYHADGSTDGSSANLRVGESMKLKDMLYALMLPSGDDAATAIADALGGTNARFVQRMNFFAYHLHLFETHYVNPDGLTDPSQDDQHYTSAADLARLAAYAMKIPLFAQIVQTPTYTVNGHTWNTTNYLLTSQDLYTGATGIKTGTTNAAGYCLVFSASRNGHHLLGVVLHSATEAQRFTDARALLDWGFSLPLLPPTA